MTDATVNKDVNVINNQPTKEEETKMETKENKEINFNIPMFYAIWMWNKEEGHGLTLVNKADESKSVELTLEKGKEALEGLWEMIVRNKDRIVDFLLTCVGGVASLALKAWEEIKAFFLKVTNKEK